MNSTADLETTRRRVRRHPRRRVIVLLIAFLTVITLIIGEVAVRGYLLARGWTANCYAPQLDMFVPDATNGATLRKNFRLRSGVFETSTNQLGLRGDHIESSKSANTTRIAVLGGSSAFGYFASDHDAATSILETLLSDDGMNVEVINAGVPGYNLFQSIERYREIVSPLKPDIVILYLGWNDLTYVVSENPTAQNFQKRSLAPLWERILGNSALYCLVAYRLFERTPNFVPRAGMNKAPTPAGEKQFRKNLDELLLEVKESGAEAIVIGQLMAAHRDAPEETRKYLGSAEEEIDKVVSLGEWLRDELRQFAEENSLKYVDANESIAPTTEHLGDAIHLTLTGEKRIADLWKNAVLNSQLQLAPGESPGGKTNN